MQNYIYYLQDNQLDAKTIKVYQQSIAEMQQWYTETNGLDYAPENITPLDMKDFISWLVVSQKLAPATINKKIAALKSYFSYLISIKSIDRNPMQNIKAQKTSALQQVPHWLPRNVQARVLHAIQSNKNNTKRLRDCAIFQTLLQAGLRSFEVVALDIADIDLRRNTLTVRKGKGNKMSILPVNKELNNALRAYLEVRGDNGEPALFLSERKSRLTDRAVRHQFRKYFDQCNLPDISTHSLRHSYCKNLLDTGTQLTVVAMLARHEKLDTTRRYLTPDQSDLRQAVDRISAE